MKLYMLRIDNENGDYLGDVSFESARARQAFEDGWLYATCGDDADAHHAACEDFIEWGSRGQRVADNRPTRGGLQRVAALH